MTPRPGDFWVANILFTDQSASKKRPILVLWLDAADVVAAVVTSAPPRTPTDVPLADWQAAGLRVASTVRLSRLDCLEQSLLLFRLGQVSAPDGQQIKTVWDKDVKPQF
jgi:mRNA interferase MazF